MKGGTKNGGSTEHAASEGVQEDSLIKVGLKDSENLAQLNKKGDHQGRSTMNGLFLKKICS